MQNLGTILRWTLVVLPLTLVTAAAPTNPTNQEVNMNFSNTSNPERSVADGATVEDVQMQAHVTGEGPPLVLVGGGLTGWKSWEPHAERLAATHTVARLQPLNVQFGLEDRRLPERYGVSTESAALAATIEALGWNDPLDLVGWSYGALIALDFALNHPERIRTLTLIEPPAAWVLPDYARHDPDVQALQSLELDEDVSEANLEQLLRAVGLIPPGISPTELPQWSVWMEHRQSLRVALLPFEHRDDPARLRAFDRPVWLVTGTGTATFLRRIHDTLAARLPRARTAEMPAGHGPHIVSMDRFMAELTRFHKSTDVDEARLGSPSDVEGK